ncbi:hypothetical protein F5879DRAFT_943125, partial [Lentinula edodes]
MYYTYLARRKTLFAWMTIQGALATFVASQYIKPKYVPYSSHSLFDFDIFLDLSCLHWARHTGCRMQLTEHLSIRALHISRYHGRLSDSSVIQQ